MHKATKPAQAEGRVPAILYNEDGAKRFETEDELDAALEDGYVDHPAKVGAGAAKKPAPKKAEPKKEGETEDKKSVIAKKPPATLKRKED